MGNAAQPGPKKRPPRPAQKRRPKWAPKDQSVDKILTELPKLLATAVCEGIQRARRQELADLPVYAERFSVLKVVLQSSLSIIPMMVILWAYFSSMPMSRELPPDSSKIVAILLVIGILITWRTIWIWQNTTVIANSAAITIKRKRNLWLGVLPKDPGVFVWQVGTLNYKQNYFEAYLDAWFKVNSWRVIIDTPASKEFDLEFNKLNFVKDPWRLKEAALAGRELAIGGMR